MRDWKKGTFYISGNTSAQNITDVRNAFPSRLA
jgi:hypothetical protein